jgi:hypothetical protein
MQRRRQSEEVLGVQRGEGGKRGAQVQAILRLGVVPAIIYMQQKRRRKRYSMDIDETGREMQE